MLKSLLVRDAFSQTDKERFKELKFPSDIKTIENVVYGDDKNWNLLDIYYPADYDQNAVQNKKYPVIISVHGGSWVYGTKEEYKFYCAQFALRGFAVVNFTYRLTPEFKFPCHLEDVNLVCNFVFDNAQKFSFDTSNIFGLGDSAGAHLLGLYVEALTDPQYMKNYNFKVSEGFSFKSCCFNSGDFSIKDNGRVNYITNCVMKEMLKDGGTETEYNLISVVKNMNDIFVPCMIVSSSEDYLLEQAMMMLRCLMEHKIPHEYKFYSSKEWNEKLEHAFMLDIRKEAAIKSIEDECEFFKKFI